MSDADKSLKTSIETDASAAIAEQERYNKKLQEMAAATDAAAKASKELADAEAYAALKTELKTKASERAATAAAEVASAISDLEKTTKTYSQAEVEAVTAAVAGDAKNINSKKLLKESLKGLSLEIPILGRAWAFVSNPITASVAAITGAFTLWNYRVKELTSTFASFELPDLSRLQPKTINEATEAWKGYNEALIAVEERTKSIETVSAKTLAHLTRTVALIKQLDQIKGTDNPLVDREGARAAAATKDAAGRALVQRGQQKARKAAGIHIAGSDSDSADLTDMKAQAAVSQEAIETARSRLGDIAEAEGGDFWSSRWNQFRGLFRYGRHATDFKTQREIEHGNIASAQSVVDRYNKRVALMPQRNKTRATRDQLYSEAPQDIEAGRGMMEEARADWKNANVQYAIDLERKGIPRVATPTGAGGSVTTEGMAEYTKLKELQAQVLKEFRAYSEAWLRELSEANARAKNQR